MIRIFYNGTAICGYDMENYNELNKSSYQMIKHGLKCGKSLEQQKKDYKEQLDAWENEISKYPIVNLNVIRLVAKKFDMEIGDFLFHFNINILALLRLKVIKNDDNNGTLFIGIK